MRVFNLNNISTSHNSEKNILHLQLNGQIPHHKIVKAFSDVLRFAYKRKIKKWILDLSRIEPLSEKSESWFNTNLYPNMMIRFGPKNYIGFVLPQEEYNRRLNESGLQGLQSYNSYIIINTFTSSDQAFKWIETCNSGPISFAWFSSYLPSPSL